jgi:long-chain acyl-CoA synthetase
MTALSLAVVLAEAARWRPDKIGVVDPWERITFAELWSASREIAGGLAAFGIEPDDHVALMCPNLADFPRAYYGILAAGGVVVPVHLLLTADEVAYVLRDSAAKVLLCHTSQLAVGAPAAAAAGIPLIVVGPLPAGSASGLTRLEALRETADAVPTFVSRQAEDAAVIFYTSGTTGAAKGAVLTHLNLVMNVTVGVYDTLETHPEDVVLGCLPLFHIFGQSVSMNGAFRRGSTLVLLPRFSGDSAIETMLAEKVDVFHGVPTMYIGLLAAAESSPELPALRACVSGGAPLPTSVLDRFQEVFGTTIYEGYGLSETSPSATTNQPTFGTRPGTVGHPIWGVEVRVARPEIEERVELLGPDELGEVVIRGHNVFAGYWGRPEATEAALVDGWFRTGDLGRLDGEGFVTIVDRKKDVVIRGGFNVYPTEVEEVLARHPAVAQVAVIGLRDDVYGEEVVAVVVPRDQPAFPPEQEFIAWSREHLGAHKYPRRVHLMTSLPVGPSQKVLKRELRRMLGGGAGGSAG